MVVKGELDPGYATEFAGMELRSDSGDTIISGPVADQGELRGLLERIDSLGLELMSIESLPTAE